MNDVAFYQAVTRLYAKVLSECFERHDFPLVITEVERLFKTNLFNESKRNQEKEDLEKRFPELRDFNSKELGNVDELKTRLDQRISLRRQLNVLPK